MDRSSSSFLKINFVSSLFYKGPSPGWSQEDALCSSCSILSRKQFEFSLCPSTKWSFLKDQCDGAAILSFLRLQKPWSIIFPHWLFKAYFASRRDDWQTVIHMVSDKVANIIKHVILGPHLAFRIHQEQMFRLASLESTQHILARGGCTLSNQKVPVLNQEALCRLPAQLAMVTLFIPQLLLNVWQGMRAGRLGCGTWLNSFWCLSTMP